MIALKPVLEFLLGMAVVFTLFTTARSLGTQDYFVHQQIAQESALLIDEFAAIEGNIVVKYPRDSMYPVALKENTFSVSHTLRDIEVPFAPGNTIMTAHLKQSPLIISKNGNDVTISNEIPAINKFNCRAIEFSRPRIHVTDETKNIGSALAKCTGNICSRGPDTDITISIISGKEGITIRHLPDSKSKAAACNILNQIQDRDPTIPLWMLPADKIDQSPGMLIELDTAHNQLMINILPTVIG